MYGDDESFLDLITRKRYYSPGHTVWFLFDEESGGIQPTLDDGTIIPKSEWDEVSALVHKFLDHYGEESLALHNRERALHFQQQSAPAPKVEKPRKKRPGFIYLIRSEQGHHKIGKAKRLERRLSAFGLTLPFAVELIHSFASNDYTRAEAKLHARFAEKRIRGEWFDLSAEDVAWIQSLQDGDLDG